MFNALSLAAAIALVAGAAQAAPNGIDLVVNGNFETTTNGPGQLGYNTDATGWSVPGGGYSFLFASGTADTTGASGQYGGLSLWGPNNGGAAGNTLPASSPAGGNFVAQDGAFQVQPIEQTINGFVVGKTYTLTYYWGGAQQTGFTGSTTEQFIVSLGGAVIDTTAVLQNANHGFTGWQKETVTFKPTASSEVLSFLAVGTPDGEPPFSVLDGVSIPAAVPEATTWAMLLAGFGLVGFAARRRTALAA